ncbi:MAG: substrate-binding periplasmic protein [Alphaproteobacteria bacterium]
MNLFKTFLSAFILTVSGVVLAQSVVEVQEPEKSPHIGQIDSQGCGYTRPLIVAGMIGNPPFGWVERHDERSSKDLESYGLGRLVLDKLRDKLGISYKSTGFLSYNRAIAALKRGDIDLLLAAYYRPQDLGTGTTILTPGYFRNVFTVYFKKGKEIPITSLTDLDGWKGIVRREENIYPLMHQKLPRGVDLTQVSSAKRAFEMLMNGEADYLIGSPYAVEAELRRYKLNEDIVSSFQVLLDSNLFFVFTTNSDCWKLKEKFAAALQEEDFSAPKIEEMAHQLIDEWGEKFRDEPGLIEETTEEKNSLSEMMPPAPAN